MKKLFLLLISAALLASCDDETKPQQLEVTTASIQMQFGDSVKIEATSDFDITYTVSNDYSLKMNDEGYVIGRHVGGGTVRLESNGVTDWVEVVVNSKYNLFKNPVSNYTQEQDYYISKLGEPYLQTDTALYYYNYGYESNYLILFFDDEGKFAAAGLYYDYDYMNLVAMTLYERYEFVGTGVDTYFFVNALEPEDADLLAYCTWSTQYDACLAAFLPYSYVETNGTKVDYKKKLIECLETLH